METNVYDWCRIYASLTNALSVVDKIDSYKQNLDEENNADDIAFIDKLFGNCNKYVLRNLIRVLSSVIDFSRSAEGRKIFIQEGYDQVLDQKREVIDKLFGNCNKYVLRNLIRVLSSVIDFSRSAEGRKIFIQEGYEQVLDQKREVCSKIDDYLYNATQTILEDFSGYRQSVNILFSC
jgi:DNA mismatch repair ATPase MutS